MVAPAFIPTESGIGSPRGGSPNKPVYRWNPDGIKPVTYPTVTQAFQNQTGARGVNKYPAVDDAVSAMRSRQTGH